MWEWADGGKPAMLVKLLSVDVAEGTKFGKGRVTRVVSGTEIPRLEISSVTHGYSRLGGIIRLYRWHWHRFLEPNA